jgi:hypothetical protein
MKIIANSDGALISATLDESVRDAIREYSFVFYSAKPSDDDARSFASMATAVYQSMGSISRPGAMR